MQRDPTPAASGIQVSVPWRAGVMIKASRIIRKIGASRLANRMLRRAGAMTPGIRMQIWKGGVKP